MNVAPPFGGASFLSLRPLPFAPRFSHGHGGQKDFANWLRPDLTYVLWGAVERGEARFSFRLIGIIKQKLPTVDTEWLRDGVEGRCH